MELTTLILSAKAKKLPPVCREYTKEKNSSQTYGREYVR